MADDELSGLDARWPGTTDANVESMARRMMAIDLNTTTDRAGNHAASHPALVNYWRRFSRAAIEHIRDLPDQPAAEPMPVHADLSRGWTTPNTILQESNRLWNDLSRAAMPVPPLRDRSHDAADVARFIQQARDGGPVTEPEPEWRLRENGVMELVGTNAAVQFRTDCTVAVVYKTDIVFLSLNLDAAKSFAINLVATRRAFGLDV